MVVGVAKEAQGHGLGRALLQPMIDRADAACQPCYLETTQPKNVAFYEHLGFRRIVSTVLSRSTFAEGRRRQRSTSGHRSSSQA